MVDPLVMEREPRLVPRRSPRKRIADLDLSMVKQKLCLPKDQRGKGWTEEKAETTEKWYKRFLLLHLLYGDAAPCTEEIDEFWHTHILYTREYTRDCRDIFGSYMHHVPCNDLSDKDVLEDMQRATKETMARFKELWGELPPMPVSEDCWNNCSGQGSCCSKR